MTTMLVPMSSEVMSTTDAAIMPLNVRKYNRSSPLLTRYEQARIVGTRAIQLERGQAPLVDTGDTKDWIEIAEMELFTGQLHLVVRRHMEDGTYEDWPVNQLLIRDLLVKGGNDFGVVHASNHTESSSDDDEYGEDGGGPGD